MEENRCCSTCGALLDEDAMFCAECGTKIINIVNQGCFCSNCGFQNELENMFCSNCGRKMQEEAESYIDADYDEDYDDDYYDDEWIEESKTKTSRKWLIIIIVIFSCIILTAVGTLYLYLENQKESQKEEENISEDYTDFSEHSDENAEVVFDEIQVEKPIEEDAIEESTEEFIAGIITLDVEEQEEIEEAINFYMYAMVAGAGIRTMVSAGSYDVYDIEIEEAEAVEQDTLRITGMVMDGAAYEKSEGNFCYYFFELLLKNDSSNDEGYQVDEIEKWEMYLSPYSNSQYLTTGSISYDSSDITTIPANADATYLRYMRNEIYARHGYTFKDSELAKYFEAQEWYEATTDYVEESELNKYELANIELIVELESKISN